MESTPPVAHATAHWRSQPQSHPSSQGCLGADEQGSVLSWLGPPCLNHGIDADIPREAIKQAFAYGLIEEGQIWIDMMEQRNLMAHTYDQSRAERVIALVVDRFWPVLRRLREQLERRLEHEQHDSRGSS